MIFGLEVIASGRLIAYAFAAGTLIGIAGGGYAVHKVMGYEEQRVAISNLRATVSDMEALVAKQHDLLNQDAEQAQRDADAIAKMKEEANDKLRTAGAVGPCLSPDDVERLRKLFGAKTPKRK